MNAVKRLSSKDLNLLISKAAKELEARKREDLIIRELQKVFDKHGVSKVERLGLVKRLVRNPSLASNTKKIGTRRVNKKRSVVRPKYRHPSSRETWTGRGRTPKWVVSLCEERKIDLSAFKSSAEFAM